MFGLHGRVRGDDVEWPFLNGNTQSLRQLPMGSHPSSARSESDSKSYSIRMLQVRNADRGANRRKDTSSRRRAKPEIPPGLIASPIERILKNLDGIVLRRRCNFTSIALRVLLPRHPNRVKAEKEPHLPGCRLNDNEAIYREPSGLGGRGVYVPRIGGRPQTGQGVLVSFQ
jgi:hypothetical protein